MVLINSSLKEQVQLLSKIATNDGHSENSPYFEAWKAYDSDPYHSITNPQGVIQMGLAENQLSFDVIKDWIVHNQSASICTSEGVDKFTDIAIYQDYHGLPKFRNATARFMEKVRGDKVTFDPDRIVMSGGATGAHEMMAFCLADPGDAFLVPTPYYPGFDRDLKWRTGVQLVPVICESYNNFRITRTALETAYQQAGSSKTKVKGLLITNPSNPLGTILDRATLEDLVSFINEKSIHLVCDEIYAGTVFKMPEFISIAEIIEEDIKCNRDLVHIVYSLSKDMGFPGFRIGIVYSYNDNVVNCARKMSSFGLVSTQTQHLIAAMLSDEIFVEKFIMENRERLGSRHEMFTQGLAQVGIGNLNGNGGLFLWMDLRKLLKQPTFEAEMELWKSVINNVKLSISPGSSFHCSEPGWFRVCLANMDDETTKVALQRIKKFALQTLGALEVKPKKLSCQRSLKLSLSFQTRDGIMMSPHMSPHSPSSTIA
ncbi:1-aminocyclopropane-1-carboxylate synthase-like [Apium graveolens]|uniref:1-aminocyclopropane-1-carboxylate synthase-like n=1 Tax=Apium graveolens TaxID=4045 RepID=UPI003D7B3BD9